MPAKPTILLLLLLITSGVVAQSTAPSEHRPVPHSAEQARALNAIHQQFKSEYAKRENSDRLRLAEEFRKQAAQVASSDPVRQYVLLREARSLAVQAGSFDEAFAAIDDLCAAFTLDCEELKVTVLTEAVDRARISKPELLEDYLRITDKALEDGQVNFAYQASRMAYRVAALLRDPTINERVKQMDLRVHDARRELTAVLIAAQKLQRKPDDPANNLLVGRYLCFVMGKFPEGIPYLEKGSDKKLADLADRDQANPDDPNAMFNLADAWWNLPETYQTPARRSHQRAVYWYEKAMPRLSGAKKATAQARINELKQEFSNERRSRHSDFDH